jgi:hypothetical protein
MPAEPEPLSIAEVVSRAVSACELGEASELLDELLERFEDADEPVSSAGDLVQRLDETAGAMDPEGEDPALLMAAAVTVYLAHRRDEFDAEPATLLHLAARAEFDGEPPPAVRRWLRAAGVEP